MLRSRQPSQDTALLAFGSSAGWSVSIDESIQEDEQYTIEIEGPQFYVTFIPKSLAIIGEAIAFLDQGLARLPQHLQAETLGELSLGKWGAAAVTLIWDNEGSARCVLLIGPHRNCTLRFELHEPEIRAVLDALKQAVVEL